MAGDPNWMTPVWLFELLQEMIGKRFQLDAAAAEHNALCKRYYTQEDNGLTQRWYNPTFCNPPHGDMKLWQPKALQEARERELVCLIIGPKGCSQKWFHECCKQGTIFAPDQRIKYHDPVTGDASGGAREDTMITIYGPGWWNKRKDRFDFRVLEVRGRQ